MRQHDCTASSVKGKYILGGEKYTFSPKITVFPEKSAFSLDYFVNAEAELTQHVAFCVCQTITGHCFDPIVEEI